MTKLKENDVRNLYIALVKMNRKVASIEAEYWDVKCYLKYHPKHREDIPRISLQEYINKIGDE